MAFIQLLAFPVIQFMHSRTLVKSMYIDTNYKKESGVFIFRRDVSFIKVDLFTIKVHSFLK